MNVKDILYSKGLYNDVIGLIFDYTVGDKNSHKKMYNYVMMHFNNQSNMIIPILKLKMDMSYSRIEMEELSPLQFLHGFNYKDWSSPQPYILTLKFNLGNYYNRILLEELSVSELRWGHSFSINSLIEHHLPHLRPKLIRQIKAIISAIKTDLYCYSNQSDCFRSGRLMKKLKRDNLNKTEFYSYIKDYIELVKWGGDKNWNKTLNYYYACGGDHFNVIKNDKVVKVWRRDIFRNRFHGNEIDQMRFYRCLIEIRNGRRAMKGCKWSKNIEIKGRQIELRENKNGNVVLYDGGKRKFPKVKQHRGYDFIEFIFKDTDTNKGKYYTLFKHMTEAREGKHQYIIAWGRL